MNGRVAAGAPPVTPWLEALAAKYGAIGAGLLVGTGAKYGLTLAEGRKVTVRLVVIDALLIGMVALVAANVCDRLHIAGNTAAMVSSLFAVSSDRVLRMIRERFLRRVDAELQLDLDRVKGEIRQTAQMDLSGERVVRDVIEGRREP
jgi:NhaP-type Na+/H+ or K+/H+ antiporter